VIVADRSPWIADARCRGMNPELFYADRFGTQDVAQAKAVCAECPVRDECLQHALDTFERFGVWGGATVRERRSMRRRKLRESARCGTRAGYQRHLKNHEHCDECLEANAAYVRAKARA